jgi:hypothetical protein
VRRLQLRPVQRIAADAVGSHISPTPKPARESGGEEGLRPVPDGGFVTPTLMGAGVRPAARLTGVHVFRSFSQTSTSTQRSLIDEQH